MPYLYSTVKKATVPVFALLFLATTGFSQSDSIKPPSIPVSLLDFRANLKNDNALLNWKTTNHYNFSHFIIEKSTDARNYNDAVVIVAPESTAAENSYGYNDDLHNSTNKTVYYRLKMVDVNGKVSYSETRMVRLTERNNIQVSTFPNPATNELYVNIPNDWQEKTVTYDIYNSTGVLIKRYQNKQAAQIQQLNVQQLNNGNYVLKVNNGSNSKTAIFIKY
ncbi:MAG: T9SS type A sorting domain-containing protein [Chitinophagaceae bacterium]|nr:T9SS type A sorting domain-containing protein [Chitinophagaceae bacterium]